MPVSDNIEIKGLDELQKKIKQLPEKVKRREVLKIQRQLAKPIIKAYSAALPKGDKDVKRFSTLYPAGTLSKSVRAKTVPAGVVGGNPSVVVRPGKKGRYDSFYRFMVIRKGAKPGSNERGSRDGLNDVVKQARDKAMRTQQDFVTKKYKDQVAKYIQKNIDKLNKK